MRRLAARGDSVRGENAKRELDAIGSRRPDGRVEREPSNGSRRLAGDANLPENVGSIGCGELDCRSRVSRGGDEMAQGLCIPLAVTDPTGELRRLGIGEMSRMPPANHQRSDAQFFGWQLSLARLERGADLEQTKVALHPREIVLGSARQRLEDVAPQVRLVFGEGIEHTDVIRSARYERHGTHLDHALPDQHVADATRRQILWIVADRGRAEWTELHRETVVASKTRDFFNEIYLAGDVEPPGRDLHR